MQASVSLKSAITEKDRQAVIALLNEQGLPVSDITESTLLYFLQAGNKMIGTAGLDIFNGFALLRSVSILKELQGKGYGKFLNNLIEQAAKEKEINCLYLITNTAGNFFGRQGYSIIDRAVAPETIKQTGQFSSVCPSTAVVMKKKL